MVDETGLDESKVDEIAVDEPGPHFKNMTVRLLRNTYKF